MPFFRSLPYRPLLIGLLCLSSVGCSGLLPRPAAPEAVRAPARWSAPLTNDTAPLPHQGDVQSLRQWWEALGDTTLVQLIDAAQTHSPTLASATSRLVQARAALGLAGAANRPVLEASASAQRGVNASSPTPGTGLQAALNVAWEADLFGANLQAARAAEARLEGAQALWHEARVAVAADVAARVWGWRLCQAVVRTLQSDTDSRQMSAGLVQRSAQAGFVAATAASAADAAAAEGRARLMQQQTQCDSQLQSLRALTDIDEPVLRKRLSDGPGDLPAATRAPVPAVPAALLAQRPDVHAAEREVAAASAEWGAAEAQRYPRLGISGSIGTLNFSNAAGTTDLSTWSIGPISLTLPVLDGGRRIANTEAAQARYTEAQALYRARVREAVREVEDALLMLHSVRSREPDAQAQARAAESLQQATEARLRAGMASQLEFQEARRATWAAQLGLLQLAQERSNAWVGLYRALGGGWQSDAKGTATP